MNISIVGGGIGGLALSASLHRQGVTAHVYEASEQLYSFGGGLLLPPNSQRVLAALGLERQLREQGVALEDMQIRDASGKLLYRSDQTTVASHHGYGMRAAPRVRLHHWLSSLVPDEQLHSGHRLSQLQTGALGTTATFENGAMVRSDLLVGADGRTSRTRQVLFPECQLVSTGQVAFRGVANIEPDETWNRSFVEFWDAGRRFTFFKQAQGSTYWHAPLRLSGHKGVGNAHQMLLDEYAHFPEQVLRLINATKDIHSVELTDISPLPEWWYGRVVLIGDAAHATSPNLGQGAAQALEDSAALAHALTHHASIPAALNAYQNQREAKANAVVSRSRQMGMVGEASGALRWLRNMALAINPELARKHIEGFYA